MCSTIVDFKVERIPNLFIILGIVSGIFFKIFESNDSSWQSFAIGILIPLVSLFPLFVIRAIGAGDIKLLLVTGVYLGARGSFYVICFSIIIGAFIALMKIMKNGLAKERFMYLFDFVNSCPNISFNEIKNINYIGDKSRLSRGIKMHFSLPVLLATIFVLWRKIY